MIRAIIFNYRLVSIFLHPTLVRLSQNDSAYFFIYTQFYNKKIQTRMYETRVVRVYYDAEQTRLKEEYFEVRGKREGPCRGYHSSGYLAVHTNYVAGQRVGESIP